MSNSTRRNGRREKSCLAALMGSAALTVSAFALAPSAGAAEPGPATGVKPAAASSSAYLGGFQAVPAGGLASASATFTIPTVHCTKSEDDDGARESNGVYTDSQSVVAWITVHCTTAGPQYDYQFSTPSGAFDEPNAKPGDVVVTSLFESGSASYAEIHDLTNHDYWFASDPTDVGDTTVDLGTFNDLSVFDLPVADFGKVSFSSVTVNGDDLGFDSPTRFNAVSDSDVLIKTGGLSTTGAGSAFSATFKLGS